MTRREWSRKKMTHVVDLGDEQLPPTWRLRHPGTDGTVSSQTTELGNRVHVSGRKHELVGHLTTLLSQAKEIAVVCSFLLAQSNLEEAILNAAKRGVRVYIMVASEARLANDSDQDFDKMVRQKHKDLLKGLAGHVLVRSAEHFHAKVLLVDPHDNRAAQGVLLTANLTDAALTRNEELAVKLTNAEVQAVAALTGWAMWETAEHELTVDGRFRTTKELNSLQHPSNHPSLFATTPKSQDLRGQVLDLIDRARGTLWVSSFGWDENHPLVKRLCERAREGLEIKVLARVRQSAMPALVALCEAGAEVVGFKWLHAKAIYSNGEGIVMSANFQKHGMDNGFELGVLLTQQDAHELEQRLRTWHANSTWILASNPKLSDLVGDVQIWDDGRLRKAVVQQDKEVDRGEYKIRSLEHLEDDKPKLPQPSLEGDTLVHRTTYRWINVAPVLTSKAKELYKDEDGEEPYAPRVFQERKTKNKVIVVEAKDDIPAAIELKRDISAKAIVLAREAS